MVLKYLRSKNFVFDWAYLGEVCSVVTERMDGYKILKECEDIIHDKTYPDDMSHSHRIEQKIINEALFAIDKKQSESIFVEPGNIIFCTSPTLRPDVETPKIIYAKTKYGERAIVTMSMVYLLNDNGQTIERLN